MTRSIILASARRRSMASTTTTTIRSGNTTSRQRAAAVTKLLEFFQLQHAVIEQCGQRVGFSRALGLNSERLLSPSFDFASRCDFSESTQTLTFRMPLRSSLHYNYTNYNHHSTTTTTPAPVVALSTYMAIMDEVTTWAAVLADPVRCRPGVSVTMYGERGPAAATQHSVVSKSKNNEKENNQKENDEKEEEEEEEVDVIAKVNKVGLNLAYIYAEIRTVDTQQQQQVLFVGSHVKYLNSMGWVTNFLLSEPVGWKLAMLYCDYLLSKPKPIRSSTSSTTTGSHHSPDTLAEHMEPLKITEEQQQSLSLPDTVAYTEAVAATFEASAAHASGGGPIHGGCQAVLMEMVATEMAQRYIRQQQQQQQQQSSSSSLLLELDSMHIEFIAAPTRKCLLTTSEIISSPLSSSSSLSLSMRVQLLGGGSSSSGGSQQNKKSSTVPPPKAEAHCRFSYHNNSSSSSSQKTTSTTPLPSSTTSRL